MFQKDLWKWMRIASQVAVLIVTVGSEAAAQSVLDRRIGADEQGRPFVIREKLTTHVLGALARATGVPIGFEASTAAPNRSTPITLSGLTLGQALDAITTMTPGHEWREMDGVIVFRPAEAWADHAHPLQAPAPAIRLNETSGAKALALVGTLLGAHEPFIQFSDSKRFPLHVEQGTILDLLNATVREHGELAWWFEPNPKGAASGFPFTVMLLGGGFGAGFGVPGHRAGAPIDVSRFEEAAAPSAAILNRIVGPKPNGDPLTVRGPHAWSVGELATATSTSIGLEGAPRLARAVAQDIAATGRPLRDVLDALVAGDPRYEWREMDGVIVIRPVRSWSDADSELFRLIPAVRLEDVRIVEAIAAALFAMGRDRNEQVTFPDGRRVSVDVPPGTVLDLLNAIVRSHGQLSWILEPSEPDDAKRTGLRHTLSCLVMGGGGPGALVR